MGCAEEDPRAAWRLRPEEEVEVELEGDPAVVEVTARAAASRASCVSLTARAASGLSRK